MPSTLVSQTDKRPNARTRGELRGVYDAPRAAALSGVPRSTLHYWARNGIYLPAISPDPRTRLWSWYDLLALRAINWFRRAKPAQALPRVPFARIREALEELERRNLPLADLQKIVAQSHGGEVFITVSDQPVRADRSGQAGMPGVLALVPPYEWGPDLLEPRPLLRIIPGKLLGEPHLVNTRIPSALIYALNREGFEHQQIRHMYPEADPDALEQAIDLESSLSQRAA